MPLFHYEEGSELVVLGVSDSLLGFVFAVATGTSIFANSTTSSLIGCYRSGVFSSSSSFSFYGFAFGDGSGGQLDPACDLEINFRISTTVVSILYPKLTRMPMIFVLLSWCSCQRSGPCSRHRPDSLWLHGSAPGLPSFIPSADGSPRPSSPTPPLIPPPVMSMLHWWPPRSPYPSTWASSAPCKCFRACNCLGA